VSVSFVDELEGCVGWIEESRVARTGHALAAGGRVWLIDPIDGDGVDERVRRLGDPVGVIQLLDRHNRSCADLARRYAVSHHVAPLAVSGSPFVFVNVVRRRWWREVALWWPEPQILVCADAIGTSRFFRAGDEPAGVHPLLRLAPPQVLRALAPLHLLVGHGEGLHGDATRDLYRAIDTARRRLPRALASALLSGRERPRAPA